MPLNVPYFMWTCKQVENRSRYWQRFNFLFEDTWYEVDNVWAVNHSSNQNQTVFFILCHIINALGYYFTNQMLILCLLSLTHSILLPLVHALLSGVLLVWTIYITQKNEIISQGNMPLSQKRTYIIYLTGHIIYFFKQSERTVDGNQVL